VKWVRMRLMIVTALSLLVLAACGGEATNNTNTGANPTTAPAGGATELAIGVQGSTLKFDKETLTVKAGEKVKITFSNTGSTLNHSFVIDNPAVSIPADKVVGLAANATGSAEFTAPAAGSYDYYCGVPGHKEAGMVGKLTVQ
jgi:plastocyanin